MPILGFPRVDALLLVCSWRTPGELRQYDLAVTLDGDYLVSGIIPTDSPGNDRVLVMSRWREGVEAGIKWMKDMIR